MKIRSKFWLNSVFLSLAPQKSNHEFCVIGETKCKIIQFDFKLELHFGFPLIFRCPLRNNQAINTNL